MKMSSESLIKIDELFMRLLNDQNDRTSLDQIAMILSKELNLKFNIGIDNSPVKTGDIYFMRVEPKKSTLQKIVEASVVKRDYNMVKTVWEKENEWFITIQSIALSGKVAQITNRELTALLLHELGHVIYTNSTPNRAARVFQYETSAIGYTISQFLNKFILFDAINTLMASLIVTLCQCDFDLTYSSIREEINADQNVVRYGYKAELLSLLDKVLKSSSMKAQVKYNAKNGSRFDNLVHMSCAMINSIKIRKFYIALDFFAKIQLLHTSLFWNHWFGFIPVIKNAFGTGGIFHESSVEKIEEEIDSEFVNEFSVFTKKLDRLEPTMLDYISIKVDSIETNDDKLMILTYIHSKLDLVDYYIHVAENPGGLVKVVVPHSLANLQAIRKELLRFREKAMNTKVEKIKYGIYINYPDGFGD